MSNLKDIIVAALRLTINDSTSYTERKDQNTF